MKILLTGITGFLGSYLARTLIANRHTVIGLKRRTSDVSRLSNLERKAVIFFDVEDSLDHLFEIHPDIDLVIHTATSYGNQGELLSEVLMANIIFPLRIMELASLRKKCIFINTDTFFCKTSEEYPHWNGYVTSKKIFFQLAVKFAKTHQCSFVNIRLEHVFGPGDGQLKFTSSIIRKLLDDVPEIKLTSGEQLRDFIYIDDVVRAYLKIISSVGVMKKFGVRYFEVGTGAAHSVKDFVITAHRIIGSKSNLLFGALPYRENEIMFSKANLDTLADLGWGSSVKLEEGLKNVISSM
jgi:CDP-paratose synthetase